MACNGKAGGKSTEFPSKPIKNVIKGDALGPKIKTGAGSK